MKLNKDSFLQAGFDVHETTNSLIITTPQTFISGDPACFWVKNHQDKLQFNDYGSSLNALELSLPNPDKAYEVLQNSLKKLDSEIRLDGTALIRETDEKQINFAISDYLNLYAILTNYQPKSLVEQDIYAILDNIHNYLKQRFGTVETKVKYKGLSGIQHKFAFQANQHIYDFAKPNSRTTGSLLRKIADVKQIYNNLDFSIVLDDSDKTQFEKESRILSSNANIKPLSLLVA